MNKEAKVNQVGEDAINLASAPFNPLGVHASVSFGTSQGGPCAGKGVCKLQSVEPTAINVCFHLSPLDKELLLMVFSFIDLKTNQPDQVQYFTDPSKTYQFDAVFEMTDQIFAALGLLPNPRISPQSPTEVLITNETVITLIKYDHD